ncbi:MAG: iron complex outermembrane receptor protein [Bermanella sp.]|jgi:iron complex outermembrane receptor protein
MFRKAASPAAMSPTVKALWLMLALGINAVNAYAQTSREYQLEEVVVTAQKKTESLQDTPISIAAFGTDVLEKEGIANLNDIASKVPSLTVDPFPTNVGALRLFIRGVGITDMQVTMDPPVAIYLDGVYIARSTGLSFEVAELARIEVLRGPQGTLYGRNATGGALNMVSRRPSTEALEFKQKVTFGDRDLRKFRSSLNLPVTDRLALRATYMASEQSGFTDNAGPGGDFGDRELSGYLLNADWQLSDNFSVAYAYDYSEYELYAASYQPTRKPRSRIDPNDATTTILGQISANVAPYINYTERRLDTLTTVVPLEASQNDVRGHTFNIVYRLSADHQMKYIFGSRSLSDNSYIDMSCTCGYPGYRLDNNDYTTRDGSQTFPGQYYRVRQEQDTHELQLSGFLFDESVEYFTGLYHFEESGSDRRSPLALAFTGPLNIHTVGTATTTTYLTQFQDLESLGENSAWAAYARFSWTPAILDKRMTLSAGYRHSEDERKARKYQRLVNIVEPETVDALTGARTATPFVTISDDTFDANNKRSDSDDSIELVAEYTLTETINSYLKYVEAYKSGGFNVRDPDVSRFKKGFAPEFVSSYELGLKSEFFDRRLRLNGDVFFSDFTDMQTQIIVPGNLGDSKVLNAGTAKMSGLELDLTWLLMRGTVVTASYAYLDAQIEEVIDPDTGAETTDDYTFSNAPRHSASLRLDYAFGQYDWGNPSLNLSYDYMGERDGTIKEARVADARLQHYGLVNARLGVYDIPALGGRVSIAAWGKNLLDKEYAVSTLVDLPTASRAVLWGEARNLGLDITYDY